MRKEGKESLAYILAIFLYQLAWFSCCFKGMSLFVSIVSPDYEK